MQLWNSQVEFLDKVGEEGPIIVSIHLLEYVIVSALDRDVKVRANFIRL